MPKPFIQLNAAEFSGLLNPIKLIRKIDSIHLTSSWRPAQHQFRGQESLDELHDFHVLENGDTDLPQHLTIDPCGSLWTGRNWNIPPLSARGFSGNHQSGPLLITLIGDFSSGADQVTQEQREALVTICLALCSHFSINPSAIHLLGDFVKLEGSNDAALRELVTDPKWLGTATPAPKTSAQKKPATDPARLNTLGRVFSLLTATPGAGLVQRVLDESSRSSESIDYSARSLQRWLGESVPSDDQLQKMKPY